MGGDGKMNENKEVTKVNAKNAADIGLELHPIAGIPMQFMVEYRQGNRVNWYVTKAGLLYKARKDGLKSLRTTIHHRYSDEEPWVEAETMVEMGDGRTANAFESASKGNLPNAKLHPYMLEMAETRSTNRALSKLLACGFVSIEEMQELDTLNKATPPAATDHRSHNSGTQTSTNTTVIDWSKAAIEAPPDGGTNIPSKKLEVDFVEKIIDLARHDEEARLVLMKHMDGLPDAAEIRALSNKDAADIYGAMMDAADHGGGEGG